MRRCTVFRKYCINSIIFLLWCIHQKIYGILKNRNHQHQCFTMVRSWEDVWYLGKKICVLYHQHQWLTGVHSSENVCFTMVHSWEDIWYLENKISVYCIISNVLLWCIHGMIYGIYKSTVSTASIRQHKCINILYRGVFMRCFAVFRECIINIIISLWFVHEKMYSIQKKTSIYYYGASMRRCIVFRKYCINSIIFLLWCVHEKIYGI